MYRLVLLLLFFTIACNSQNSRTVYLASNHPVSEIIKEIVGTKGEVYSITQPGDSPHTYTPKPSDAKKAAQAKALFFVSKELDNWAEKIDSPNKIAIMDLLPKEFKKYYGGCSHHEGEEHQHEHKAEELDPHFWLDPLAVKSVVQPIVEVLSKADPDNAESFKANAQAFEKRLDLLNKQVEQILYEKQGKTVFLFHPSFLYFLERYGLEYGGAIEVSPGKEATAAHLSELINKIKETNTRAIFSEPQLPESFAKTIAENTGTLLFVLDPLGGTEGRVKYADLILYNAMTFKKAL